MKKLHFHIFLMLLGFVMLLPVIWVVVASVVQQSETRVMLKRIFTPETMNLKIDKNLLEVEYRFETMTGKASFPFGMENANKFVILKIVNRMENNFKDEMSFEAVDALQPMEPTLDKSKWIATFKLDANANIVANTMTINSSATRNFFNILTFDNYKKILGDREFQLWLMNSVIVSIGTGAISIFFGFFAGYAFSRFRFPGRKVGLMWVLITQLFPLAMMLVPFYILATSVLPKAIPGLSIVNSLPGLIIVYAATALPFSIWMLKGHFDTIPIDLEEAAYIDGATLGQLLWHVLLPLSRPAMFTAFLFSFVQAWNEYAIASLFMNSKELYTLPIGLNVLLDPRDPKIAEFASAAVIASLPVVVLFLLMKKELVEGSTLGAVKG